jgi:RNA polymerase sigma-70 factor (ECF subfamily)
MAAPQDPERFPLTNWSEVRRAGQPAADLDQQALSALLARYRPALQTHLERKGLPTHEAEDLLHNFLADKLLRGALLAGVSAQKGRFRTYLLTALDRYRISAHRRDTAGKRAPAEGFVVLDELEQLPPDPAARPADAGDVEWARATVAVALERVRADCMATGRAAFWTVFERRLLGPLLRGEPPPPYAELVAGLGLQSPTQATNALLTTKRMFTRHLRAVVAEYAASEEAVAVEIAELRAILLEATP